MKHYILVTVALVMFFQPLLLWAGVGGQGTNSTSIFSSSITNIQNTQAGTSYDTANATGALSGVFGTRNRVKNLYGLQTGTDQAASQLGAYFEAYGRLPANAELLVAGIIGGSLSYDSTYYGYNTYGISSESGGTYGINGIENWVTSVVPGRFVSYGETVSSDSIVVGTAASGSRDKSHTFTVKTGGGTTVSSHTTTLHLAVTSTANGTAYVVNGTQYVSPLVLDMDGDGKLEASGGKWEPHASELDTEHLVSFDIFGNGMEEIIEWVGPNDGLLVEPNSDGTVDGNSLFGSVGGFANGYEKLSLRDGNGDMKISGAELKGLFVWQDKNGNGKVDPGELKSVQELGISEIKLVNKGFVSSFTMNGKKYAMWDWWPNVVNTKKIRIEEFRNILENK